MKAVIIGAGQTGRGLIARLLYPEFSIVFVDKNEELLSSIKDGYRISFFGGKRDDIFIDNFSVLSTNDPISVKKEIAESSIVLISVKVENLESVIPLIEGIELPPVLVVENGVEPSKILREKLPQTVKIADALVFTTTLAVGKDILSQDYGNLPYDASSFTLSHSFPFTAEKNMKELGERKLYTYNTLSALICYMGAEKGYTVFGEAANDEDIKRKMLLLRDTLDSLIVRRYKIDKDEELEFSLAAVNKFTSLEIYDTVERNARSVRRKLGKSERISAPIVMCGEYGENDDILILVFALAYKYGVSHESLSVIDMDKFLIEECGIETERTRARIKKKIEEVM